jgi:hypothetical protein
VAAVPLVLAFAFAVLVPLTLRVAGVQRDVPRRLVLAYPLCAACALVAILVRDGAAVILSLVWLAYCVLVATHGLARVLFPDGRRIEELCVAAGCGYLAVGGVWFVLWRSGVSVAGFGEHVPLLTAIHFHYAGFTSLVLVGLTGRELRRRAGFTRRIFMPVALVVIVGPALVALGIAGVSGLEAPAAVVFAIATGSAAVLTLAGVVPNISGPLRRTLLALSAASAVVAMALAVVYASGNAIGQNILSVEDMARLHGLTNAFGYAFCGVLAWNLRGRL